MNILVLNSGSSNLKFQLIATDPGQMAENKDERLCRGQIENIGGESILELEPYKRAKLRLTASLGGIGAALHYIVRWITSDACGLPQKLDLTDIHAVGHRVVHGGERFSESVLITDAVLKGIEECIELAPLHNPDNIKGILAAREVFGEKLPQVAVFDTAFHHSLPERSYLYAIPLELYERHKIRRYGFHGTSHRYVSGRYSELQGLTPEQTNIITLHLGNGCSAAAIRGGRSVDTSMGMTPLEGLVMGTRSGDIDAAVVNFIAEKESISAQQAEKLLNEQSGLQGLSGVTHDMRELLRETKVEGNRRAGLAIEIFSYRARKYIGAYLACLGGTDAVVFTGGIGENAAEIRSRICEGLEWAGLKIDQQKNKQMDGQEGQISTDGSKLMAFVIPTDEELLIARDTARCVMGAAEGCSAEIRGIAPAARL